MIMTLNSYYCIMTTLLFDFMKKMIYHCSSEGACQVNYLQSLNQSQEGSGLDICRHSHLAISTSSFINNNVI